MRGKTAALAGIAGLVLVVAAFQLCTGGEQREIFLSERDLRPPAWLLAGAPEAVKRSGGDERQAIKLQERDPNLAPNEGGEMQAIKLHERDPNFPVVLPSRARRDEGLEGSRGRAGMRWRRSFSSAAEAAARVQAAKARHSATRAPHATLPVHPSRGSTQQHSAVEAVKPSPRNAGDEWQDDRSKMYQAVHMFHKYGDKALEKLVPKSETEALFKKALLKADSEVAQLRADKEKDARLREGELQAVRNIEAEIREQRKLERDAVAGGGDADSDSVGLMMSMEHLGRSNQKALAHIVSGVKSVVQMTRAANKAGDKVLQGMAEVPAVGGEAHELMAMRERIEKMRSVDQGQVVALQRELSAAERKDAQASAGAQALSAKVVEAARGSGAANSGLSANAHGHVDAPHGHVVAPHGHVVAPQTSSKEASSHVLKEPHNPSTMASAHVHEAGEPVPASSSSSSSSYVLPAETRRSARHPLHEVVYTPLPAKINNMHVAASGFAHTDSSLACIACISGPDCHAGCRIINAAEYAKLREASRARRMQRQQEHNREVAEEEHVHALAAQQRLLQHRAAVMREEHEVQRADARHAEEEEDALLQHEKAVEERDIAAARRDRRYLDHVEGIMVSRASIYRKQQQRAFMHMSHVRRAAAAPAVASSSWGGGGGRTHAQKGSSAKLHTGVRLQRENGSGEKAEDVLRAHAGGDVRGLLQHGKHGREVATRGQSQQDVDVRGKGRGAKGHFDLSSWLAREEHAAQETLGSWLGEGGDARARGLAAARHHKAAAAQRKHGSSTWSEITSMFNDSDGSAAGLDSAGINVDGSVQLGVKWHPQAPRAQKMHALEDAGVKVD